MIKVTLINPEAHKQYCYKSRYRYSLLDIVTSFFTAELDVPIYMTQPEGFFIPGRENMRVWKALYGIKQATLLFSEKLKKFVTKRGFAPLTADVSPNKWH